MAIIYLHGFASAVKAQCMKYDALGKIAPVHPFAPDYTQGFTAVLQSCVAFAASISSVSAVVGTSMGGYTASHLARQLGVPFVAINPAINPSQSLKKYIGKHQDYDGGEYELSAEQVSSYPTYNHSGAGLIIVSNLDEVIPAQTTKDFAEHYNLPLISCDYGDHRFEDISTLIEQIDHHIAVR